MRRIDTLSASTSTVGIPWARRLVTAAALGSLLLTTASCATSAEDESATVTFALDWAPNTNHIGVYVAQELGYFDEANLKVEILPYGTVEATQLVSAGEADFGIGGQATVLMGRTAGLDLVSVYRVTQTDTGRVVALGDREDITRPADLDGLTFGGFGAPLYSVLAESTIVGDGGEGTFEEIMLDTGAYEALSQERIDFTLSVATWEDIQADIDGHPYTAFCHQDFGVPQQQSTGILSSEKYLDAHPDEAAAFVQAVARGYAYAVEHPAEAADLLIVAEPDTLSTASELVHRSTQMLAEDGYFISSERPIGAADPVAWKEFGDFLIEHGFLTDAAGTVVTDALDWSSYYTDAYLK